MAHSPDHAPSDARVILLGDEETVQHRDELAHDAAQESCVIVDAFAFEPGEPGSTDDLTEVDAVVAALGRAIADRLQVWVPFPAPDLFREQHWRRLSLVLQRHGLNVRFGRELTVFATTGGINEIDFALRREVQAVDDLDNAALASAGAESLGREIESALAAAGADAPGMPAEDRDVIATTRKGYGPVALLSESVSPPMLPTPAAPWPQRQPELKRYVRWLVDVCGVSQVATARVLNSTGQRTPRGRPWQSATVSKLLNGRYDRGGANRR